jgi:hypothetical protein
VADLGWQALRGDVRVFRLPGIYGPGRNMLDRCRQAPPTASTSPDRSSAASMSRILPPG